MARVTEERAAAFLVEPDHRRFLEPFLDRECTVACAARELGENKDRMLYRVRQMTRLGLVRVTREEPRRGRAVKVYTSTSARYFVPYDAAPTLDLMTVLLRERAAHEAALQSAMLRVMRAVHGEEAWGMLLYRAGKGVYAYDALEGCGPWTPLGDEEPAVLDYSLVTRPLSRTQAKALQRALHAVLAEFTAGPDAVNGRRYLLRAAMTPETSGAGSASP